MLVCTHTNLLMPSTTNGGSDLKNALDPIAAAPSFSRRLANNLPDVLTSSFTSYGSTKVLSDREQRIAHHFRITTKSLIYLPRQSPRL